METCKHCGEYIERNGNDVWVHEDDGQLHDAEPEPIAEWQAEERYEELLDEVYGTVTIAGIEFDTGRVFKAMDPIAFRCGMLDWADAEGIEIT